MSRPPPRYIKLQDFPAHNGNVNCIKIGTKSSGVLVTGGDDKKVNLWTIGAQTKALSLQGHQTPVDSVTFDHNEEVVAAGASSGSIKLFDLDQAKVTRAMSGHRSNVLCLELSQYGLLSGSMDTNVKVWDLRGRDVMCTFKGHKVGVTHVKFSPDGKWVASASEDGQVKIWDLVANKLLSELPGHSGAVTGLHFHPVEYLLGTCSTDKTVKVWDLETMSMVDSTPAEATGVRAMAFHPDGRHVFSALQDGLRVWSWEPPPCVQHDVVDMPWFKVSDISVLSEKNKVVGCSFNQNFVGLWVVDLKDVRPFNGSAMDYPLGGSAAAAAGRGDLPAVARSEPSLPNAEVRSRSGNPRSGGGASGAVSTSLSSAPGVGAAAQRMGSGQQHGGVLRSPSRGRERSNSGGPAAGPSLPDQPLMVVSSAAQARQAGGAQVAGNGHYRYSGAVAAGDSIVDPAKPSAASASSRGAGAAPARPLSAAHDKNGMVSVGVGVGDSLARGQVEPGQLYSMAAQEAAAAGQRLDPVSRSRVEEGGLGSAAPRAAARREVLEPAPASTPGRRTETDILADIVSKHDALKSSLAFRLSNVQLSRNFLQRGDVRGALSAARRCGDAAVGADLLAGVLRRRDPQSCTLEVVPDMVAVVEQVLSMSSENQVQIGLEIASLMYSSFHQLIRDTCSQASRVGIDLSFEQRREKCMTARISLQGLAPKLAHVSRHVSDTLSFKAQALSSDLSTL